MASKPEVDLSKLFSQLQFAGEDEDYDWGLKTSEQILKVIPNDPDALLCRLVSLIQLSEYQSAIKEINRLSKVTEVQSLYVYEKAYCLYKLEKYQDSLETLSSLPPDSQSSIRVLDLTAQIYYRLEEYEKSAQFFHKARTCEDSQERSANMAAALCYCSPSTMADLFASCPVSEDTMEQCFNLATAYLNSSTDEKMISKAKTLLQKSDSLCRESMADEEEDEHDLIPIYIQLGYALQCRGVHDKALEMYALALKLKPSSIVHTITAANNVIVLNRDKDVFDSKKKIKMVSNEQGMKKLNCRQQTTVYFNRCLFALQINQLEQCKQLLKEFKTLVSSQSEETVLVEAVLLNREKKYSESCNLLEQYISENPSCALLMYLTLAQFYSMHSNYIKVSEVLEKIPHLARHLGIISVLVSMLSSGSSDDDRCGKLLDNVIDFWKSKKSDILSPVRQKAFWQIGHYVLQRGSPEKAASIFEYLCKEDSSNIRYLANLISAYSRYDTQKAEELSHRLSHSYVSPNVVDVDMLEQMPSFKHTRRQVAKNESASLKKTLAAEVPEKKNKKKKRKPRLPKSYDPSKPPDPERWLPLRERSYYRKSKKKGQQSSGVGRGTQGMSAASASLAAKLDASKQKPSEDVSKGSASSPRPKPVPHQARKKKKGRR